MKAIALVRAMRSLARDHGKRVFTLREMCAFTGEPRPRMAMTLTRAARSGIAARVRTQWIDVTDPPEHLDLALALVSPSCLSFESALYMHGVISQSPRAALTMATTGRSGVVATPIGEVRFHHLAGGLFFGYDVRRIASPEKALLDLAYLRGRRGREGALPEDMDLDPDVIDRKAMVRMARRFPAWVRDLVIGRIGGG